MKRLGRFALLMLGGLTLACSATGGGGGSTDVTSIQDTTGVGSDIGLTDTGGATGTDGSTAVDAVTFDAGTLDAGVPDTTVADAGTDAGPIIVPDTSVADVHDAGPPEPDVTEPQPLVLPGGLKGIAVDGYPDLIEFTAVVDENASPVGPSDVKGNWTVMWFYPAANTFG